MMMMMIQGAVFLFFLYLKKIHINCLFSVFFFIYIYLPSFKDWSNGTNCEMNLRQPEGCFKPYISSSTNRFSLTLSRKRQNLEEIKRKKVTVLYLWPTSWQHGVVSQSVHFLALVANLLNLGTVG